MNERAVDFYIKGLPFDDRQEIFKRLETVAPKIEKLLEKPLGYPRYRSVGYTDEQIASQESKGSASFRAVNDFVLSVGRRPFFSNPDDTYVSATEYVELMKKRTKEELAGIFGCSWEEYVPKILPQEAEE